MVAAVQENGTAPVGDHIGRRVVLNDHRIAIGHVIIFQMFHVIVVPGFGEGGVIPFLPGVEIDGFGIAHPVGLGGNIPPGHLQIFRHLRHAKGRAKPPQPGRGAAGVALTIVLDALGAGVACHASKVLHRCPVTGFVPLIADGDGRNAVGIQCHSQDQLVTFPCIQIGPGESFHRHPFFQQAKIGAPQIGGIFGSLFGLPGLGSVTGLRGDGRALLPVRFDPDRLGFGLRNGFGLRCRFGFGLGFGNHDFFLRRFRRCFRYRCAAAACQQQAKQQSEPYFHEESLQNFFFPL